MSGKANQDFITHQGQICYDQILPDHFNHASIRWSNPGGGGATGFVMAVAVSNKVWPKKILNVSFMETAEREEEILGWARIWSECCAVQFKRV